ncbi:hypothetical protein EIP86_010218 [Pleurotus ostreatoroseus]|nr:hypothetical protein EIP86_010218 [Pleurotus ostreatoroseus]
MLLAINVAFLLRGAVFNPDEQQWDPLERSCPTIFNTTGWFSTLWASFATDLGLMVIMLAGLWRYRGTGSLWKLVFRQVIFRRL